MTPADLIATARKNLGNSGGHRPSQSDLKRATSTAYYAVISQSCWVVTDTFIGGQYAERSIPASRQAYRSIDHGFAKSQFRYRAFLDRFSQEVNDIAFAFVELQAAQYSADNDPLH